MTNNIKPYFQTLEKPSWPNFEHPLKPLYAFVKPYPRAPRGPVLERPITAILDKLNPSGSFSLRLGQSPINGNTATTAPHSWDLFLEFEKTLKDLGPLHGSSSGPAALRQSSSVDRWAQGTGARGHEALTPSQFFDMVPRQEGATISYCSPLGPDLMPLSELRLLLNPTGQRQLSGGVYEALAMRGGGQMVLNPWPWGPYQYVYFEQKNRLMWE